MIQQYTCGACGETFGSNVAEDEIECAYCDVKRCPCCRSWFGGQQ
jgi:DNA-directed RNA polymerase subunit RPC12/RpoP